MYRRAAVRGAVARSASLVVQTILGFATTWVIAGVLGTGGMGVVGFLSIIYSIYLIVIGVGMGTVVAKYIAEYRRDEERYMMVLCGGALFRATVSIVVFAVMVAFSEEIAMLGQVGSPDIIRFYAFYLLLEGLGSYAASVLWGLGFLDYMSLYMVAANIVRSSLVIAFVLQGFGVMGILYGWIIGSALYFTLCSKKGASELAKAVKGLFRYGPRGVKFILPLSAVVLFSGGLGQVIRFFDSALVLALYGRDALGVYTVATRIFTLADNVITGVRSALAPYYSSIVGAGNTERLRTSFRRASKILSLLLAPTLLALAGAAPAAIPLLFGEDFAMSGVVLMIFLATLGLISAGAAFGGLFTVLEWKKEIVFVDVSKGVLTVVFEAVLCFFGSLGIALGRCLGRIYNFVVRYALLNKKGALSFDYRAFKIGIGMGALGFLMTLALGYLNRLLCVAGLAASFAMYLAVVREGRLLEGGDVELIELIVKGRFINVVRRVLLKEREAS